LRNQLAVLIFSLLFFCGNLVSSENQIIEAIRQGNFNKEFIQSFGSKCSLSDIRYAFVVLDEDIPNFKETCDSFFNFYISRVKELFGKIPYNQSQIILYWAARLGRIEFIKYAFDINKDKSWLGSKGALAIAAQAPKKYIGSVHCYMQVLNFLTPKYVNINEELDYYNSSSFKYQTALMIAATYDQPEIVLWLLINGANPDYISSKDESFITIANGKPRILAVFNQYKEYKDSLSKD